MSLYLPIMNSAGLFVRLGFAAGAAVAYAVYKHNEKSEQSEKTESSDSSDAEMVLKTRVTPFGVFTVYGPKNLTD